MKVYIMTALTSSLTAGAGGRVSATTAAAIGVVIVILALLRAAGRTLVYGLEHRNEIFEVVDGISDRREDKRKRRDKRRRARARRRHRAPRKG